MSVIRDINSMARINRQYNTEARLQAKENRAQYVFEQKLRLEQTAQLMAMEDIIAIATSESLETILNDLPEYLHPIFATMLANRVRLLKIQVNDID